MHIDDHRCTGTHTQRQMFKNKTCKSPWNGQHPLWNETTFEHIVGCFFRILNMSHNTFPYFAYAMLLWIMMHIYIYIQLYTSTYISYITIYPIMVIGRDRYNSCFLGPFWGPWASPFDEAHRRAHQADLQQWILRSALASHGDSHTAVLACHGHPWPWRNMIGTWPG